MIRHGTNGVQACVGVRVPRTQIQGCLRASEAVMRLLGLMVSILLIRSLASGVTVSHSGDGNWQRQAKGVTSVRADLELQPCCLSAAYVIGPSFDLLVKAVLVLIPKGWVAHQKDV